MRKKQLLAFLMAGALSVGMTPAAAFAAEDTAVEASGEEVAGELDGTDAAEAPAEETTEEETPAESETPAEETADNTDTAETPAEEETPAENTAEEEAPAQAEETQTPAEETTETAAIMINETAYGSLAEAFAALPDTSDPINDPTYIKIRGELKWQLLLMFRQEKVQCWLQQKKEQQSNVRLDLPEVFLQSAVVL